MSDENKDNRNDRHRKRHSHKRRDNDEERHVRYHSDEKGALEERCDYLEGKYRNREHKRKDYKTESTKRDNCDPDLEAQSGREKTHNRDNAHKGSTDSSSRDKLSQHTKGDKPHDCATKSKQKVQGERHKERKEGERSKDRHRSKERPEEESAVISESSMKEHKQKRKSKEKSTGDKEKKSQRGKDETKLQNHRKKDKDETQPRVRSHERQKRGGTTEEKHRTKKSSAMSEVCTNTNDQVKTDGGRENCKIEDDTLPPEASAFSLRLRQLKGENSKILNTKKKDKQAKRMKLSKARLTRSYFSDSELENVNKKSKNEAHQKPARKSSSNEGTCSDKPIDVDALYNLFYRDTDVHNESKVIKEAMKKKMYENTTKKNLQEYLKPVLLDQSNVRSKLIKVLFQRVKDLLKETEDLREERKTLCSKIEHLTTQVKGLKERELKQNNQEQTIKQRLDVIADEIHITKRGTSFRKEVQSILHNIQHKYQSHWREHENKIHQVQADAENDIHFLMKNVIGKYVQLNELKESRKSPGLSINKSDENSADSAIASHREALQTPLYVDVTDSKIDDGNIDHKILLPKDSNELLLKVAEPIKTFKADCQNYTRLTKPYSNIYSRPDGKDSTTPAQSVSDTEKLTENTSIDRKSLQNTCSLQMKAQQLQPGEQTHSTNQSQLGMNSQQLTIDKKEQQKDYEKFSDRLSTRHYTHKTILQQEGLKERNEPLSVNIESKEFWRNRLLQPKPLQSLNRDQGQRNQY